MEHAPTGTQIADPHQRRRRNPQIDLGARDKTIRQAEGLPEVELFETNDLETGVNAAVIAEMTELEYTRFDESIKQMKSLYRVARERYDYKTCQEKKKTKQPRKNQGNK